MYSIRSNLLDDITIIPWSSSFKKVTTYTINMGTIEIPEINFLKMLNKPVRVYIDNNHYKFFELIYTEDYKDWFYTDEDKERLKLEIIKKYNIREECNFIKVDYYTKDVDVFGGHDKHGYKLTEYYCPYCGSKELYESNDDDVEAGYTYACLKCRGEFSACFQK